MDTRDLDTIDIDTLNGYHLVEYVADINMLEARLDALKLKAVNQLAYCPPGDMESPAERTEFPGDRAVYWSQAVTCGNVTEPFLKAFRQRSSLQVRL